MLGCHWYIGLNDMKQYVEGYRDENKGDVKAFCILVVIGSQEVGTKPIDEGRFPEEDAFVTIIVPKNDTFGVTDVIVKSATASVRAEALASHSFAHVEDRCIFTSPSLSTIVRIILVRFLLLYGW